MMMLIILWCFIGFIAMGIIIFRDDGTRKTLSNVKLASVVAACGPFVWLAIGGNIILQWIDDRHNGEG